MSPSGTRAYAVSRGVALTISIAIVGIVGVVDYLTGYEMSFSVFYLVAIFLSFWLVGKRGAFFTAVLSIVVWAFADLAAGYSKPYVLVWNAVITMTFYMIVLALLSWLSLIHI